MIGLEKIEGCFCCNERLSGVENQVAIVRVWQALPLLRACEVDHEQEIVGEN